MSKNALPDNDASCAAQLNLTQYWGVWGGKYCYSAYDPPPPPGKNTTKAPCPVIKQPPIPKIRPVDLPRISQLSGGQIFVGGASLEPIQIKVTQSIPTWRSMVVPCFLDGTGTGLCAQLHLRIGQSIDVQQRHST